MRVICIGVAPDLAEQARRSFEGLDVIAVGSAESALKLLALSPDAVIFGPPDRVQTEPQVLTAALGDAGVATFTLTAHNWEQLQHVLQQLIGIGGATGESDVRRLFLSLGQDRVAALHKAGAGALAGTLDADTRESAMRAAHNMAGTGAMVGLPWVATVARQLERYLRSDVVDGERVLALTQEIGEMMRQEEQSSRTEIPSPELCAFPKDGCGKKPRVLVVIDDTDLIGRLKPAAEAQGVLLDTAMDDRQAWAHVEGGRPDVAVVQLRLGDDTEAGFRMIEGLQSFDQPVPVVVLTAHGQFEQRLRAMRLGARRFLQKPAAPSEILAAALQLVGRGETRAVALAVDDDPVGLQALQDLLRPAGVTLVPCAVPERFWLLLEEHQPDLVLLDVDMPGISGLDLCRVLRSDPRYQSLPVIFLTAFTDTETLRATFSAGADDFIGKPLHPGELITRVEARLERSRLARRLSDIDPLTGVMNRRRFAEVFRRYQHLALRQSLPLSLAILDLDRFKRINDQFGHAVGDAVLKRLTQFLQGRLRAEDAIGRLGGEEFVVAMAGATKADAAGTLQEMVGWFQADPTMAGMAPSFSGGVAEFPVDGDDLESLYRVADRALYQAKAAGRARVLTGRGSSLPIDPSVDVAVVEDDDAIAMLVSRKLKSAGLRVHHFRNGEEACKALLGADPTVTAQVILLDLGLPDIGGREVLRRLQEGGVLLRTTVIIMSAHASDREVQQSLQTGASGYITKPFSPAALLDRVLQAMKQTS